MALISRSLLFLFSLNIIFTQSTSTNGVFSKQSNIYLPSEKLTHLHFYYHDIKNKNNPTIVQIVNTPENVPNGFGATYVMDDEITEGPEMSSKHIGRAQGLFGQASLHDIGMFMLTNFIFTEGNYAGSTLSMLGRNPVAEQNREMAIVGGTGLFRFARGYVIANSVYSISSPENFVMEYNITVYHHL
ncbi:putative plant disease resistance response protein [Medicago truncatula]|uniref:Dirigent protein n=2 Tax=Medicago truncatula TaxID=3880 RepID=G7IX67_MEDTR|nr:dirigent protein 21 isoform X2 [Medicago truncatula]AES69738.1 disease resistance-responsive, dirigent domain protein [Medicago truncatula]RHN66374.1 putative plant disease resistance response protein [Medicago truncatula]